MIHLRKIVFLLCVLFPGHGWAGVFLHWTQSVVPDRKSLGIDELVIPGEASRSSVIQAAVAQGYRVYLECALEQAADAASAAARYKAAGIVVDPGDAQMSSAANTVRKLRVAYPAISVLLMNPNALQPQMKGTLVTSKNGVLQVTSPTAQPWLDTNLALVRLDRAFRPEQVPLYRFNWNQAEANQQQGPEVADYELAVAEAGAVNANVVLSLHDNLESGLAQNDEKAWAAWKEIRKYLQFYGPPSRNLIPEVNVAVIADENSDAFEPVNLLSRHNIGVKVFRPQKISESSLNNYDVAIVFSNSSPSLVSLISQFAASGRTVVLVNISGKNFPWHAGKGKASGTASQSYPVKSGQVVEMREPVSDPETFARDIRGLMNNSKIPISLWNALTSVGILYAQGHSGSEIVELVNYAEDPLEVQVKVKGEFPEVRYESPEGGCCEPLAPVIHDGFTEFQVRSLKISGRVHLEKSKSAHVSAPQT